ncbi:MAG: hypothetical protein IJT65_05010 [Eubacterium sp.]|nr:hypothetical protein [Eubacterium sp.]
MNSESKNYKITLWCLRIINIVALVLFVIFAYKRFSVDYYYHQGFELFNMDYALRYGLLSIAFFVSSVLLLLFNICINRKKSVHNKSIFVICFVILFSIAGALAVSSTPDFNDKSIYDCIDNTETYHEVRMLPHDENVYKPENEKCVFHTNVEWKDTFWVSTAKYDIKSGQDVINDDLPLDKLFIVGVNYCNSPYRSKEAYLKRYMLKKYFKDGKYEIIYNKENFEIYEASNMYATLYYKDGEFHSMLFNKKYWSKLTKEEMIEYAKNSIDEYHYYIEYINGTIE